MKEYKINVRCGPRPTKKLEKLIEEAAGINAESGSMDRYNCSTWQFYYETKKEQANAAQRLRNLNLVSYGRRVQMFVDEEKRD